MPDWRPDFLGDGLEQLTLASDAADTTVATLVRRLPPWRHAHFGLLRDVDVLYVHGWSDYFFQTEVARWWNARGARFFALDLRRYGRSLREGQTPGYVADLDEYDADIAAALAAMARGSRRLVLMGHSTGGLILTLWAARFPGVAHALVLNSPWLEMQGGPVARQALGAFVHLRATVDPLGGQPEVDFGFYTRAQREIGTLPTDVHREQWRPDRGFATHPGWFSAVLRGHERIAAGVEVGCPALVLLSARWMPPVQWAEDMTRADTVLVVDDIARAATRIGADVTVARIHDGVHDLFLSRPGPRAAAFAALDRWMLRGALD
ncbi:alpha/beta hydrolase [Microbacterium sp.]|uniref:alpha/beta hydrolase n=1 Tax=Microbacterium sp. TaxID=51671 RepID=UPI003A8A8961